MSQAGEPLYASERYKFDSREKELAEFEDHSRRVANVQKILATRHSGGAPDRVFHAKAHGCLAGRLILLADRPASTRRGLFGNSERAFYRVLARFSSGVGFARHDLSPDVRGVALKIFGTGSVPAGGPVQEGRCVDFLMTNSPNPFGTDQEEFVQFMEANLSPVQLALFLASHPRVARLLAKATLRVVSSLANERYWSGHAYLLGPDHAIKLNLSPVSSSQDGEASGPSLEHPSKFNEDYLRRELHFRLSRGPIRFVLSVQHEKNPSSTPIEDGLVEWQERDSPSIPVAELILEREVDARACSALRFTPGHYIAEHRPLGNMGRGRVFSYAASQDGRHASVNEVSEQTIFDA